MTKKIKFFNTVSKLHKPIKGMRAAVVAKSNSPQKPVIDKTDRYRKGTKLRRERDKAEKDAWLQTPEGKEAIARASISSSGISQALVNRMYPSSIEMTDRMRIAYQEVIDWYDEMDRLAYTCAAVIR